MIGPGIDPSNPNRTMPRPKPPVDLKEHCSVLHENTLYVYTPEGFVSLELDGDSKWKRLDSGQSVTGAVCVKGRRGGDPTQPALFLVGGEGDDPDYPGLQLYSFTDEKWETLVSEPAFLKNRVQHSAAYINSAASLLVYSGITHESSTPSAEYFLVPVGSLKSRSETPPPFGISLNTRFVSWSEEFVAIVGVGASQQEIWTYGNGVWEPTGASIPKPLGDPSVAQCAMVKTDDGSKVIQIFDMTAPKPMSQYVLNRADKSVPDTGTTPQDLQKREITLGNYPEYDSKYTPSLRTGFSLAQDGTQVVISGGRADDDEPILIFDQDEDGWVDPDDIFGSSTTTSTSSSSTSTTTSTSTSSYESTTVSATATSTAEPSATTSALADAGGGGGGSNTLTIVGATLGAVLGVAAILIIILLILAWRKRRGKYPGGKGSRSSDPDRLSFQDQGMEPLTRSVQPMGRATAPNTDSWAIVSGQAGDGGQKNPPPANTFNDLNFGIEKKSSPLRNVEANSPDGFDKEIAAPGAAVVGRDKHDSVRGDRLTDEGWSKYFQGDNETQPQRNISMRSTVSSIESKSDYGSTAWPHSAEVPALTLRTFNEPQSLRQIPSGSPSTEQAPNFNHLVAHQGMTAKISSADSISIASDDNHDDRRDDWRRSHLTNDRVASSNYSDSMYFGNTGSGNRLTQWPGDLQPPQEEQSNLNSDVSWLNIGGGNR